MNKLHVGEFTKSAPAVHRQRPGGGQERRGDRKWLGHAHIPAHFSEPVNAFNRDALVAVSELPPALPVPHRGDRR